MSGRKRPEKPTLGGDMVAKVNTDMAQGRRQAKRHLRLYLSKGRTVLRPISVFPTS